MQPLRLLHREGLLAHIPEPCGVHDNRWRTVRHALGSWSRTARLCLILLTLSVPSELLALMILR